MRDRFVSLLKRTGRISKLHGDEIHINVVFLLLNLFFTLKSTWLIIHNSVFLTFPLKSDTSTLSNILVVEL